MIARALRLGPLLFTYDPAKASVTVESTRGEASEVAGVNLHEWALFADAADKGLQALPLRIRMSSTRLPESTRPSPMQNETRGG